MAKAARIADIVPECLLRDDVEYDEEAVERFFGARREVIIGDKDDEKNPPLTPLPSGAFERYRAHRDGKGVAKRTFGVDPKLKRPAVAGVISGVELAKRKGVRLPPEAKPVKIEAVTKRGVVKAEVGLKLSPRPRLVTPAPAKSAKAKGGRPKTAGQRPWEAAGLSRSAWYRQHKK